MNYGIKRIVDKIKEWGPDKCLLATLLCLVLLLLFQGLRLGITGTRTVGLTRALRDTREAPPQRTMVRAIDEYSLIMEKGVLGTVAKGGPAPQAKLFGIMGSNALLGMSSENAQPYKVDAKVPGGETVVEIAADTVILEKDGEKRTLTVFPDLNTSPSERGGRPPGPGRMAGPRPSGDKPPDESDRPEPPRRGPMRRMR